MLIRARGAQLARESLPKRTAERLCTGDGTFFGGDALVIVLTNETVRLPPSVRLRCPPFAAIGLAVAARRDFRSAALALEVITSQQMLLRQTERGEATALRTSTESATALALLAVRSIRTKWELALGARCCVQRDGHQNVFTLLIGEQKPVVRRELRFAQYLPHQTCNRAEICAEVFDQTVDGGGIGGAAFSLPPSFGVGLVATFGRAVRQVALPRSAPRDPNGAFLSCS